MHSDPKRQPVEELNCQVAVGSVWWPFCRYSLPPDLRSEGREKQLKMGTYQGMLVIYRKARQEKSRLTQEVHLGKVQSGSSTLQGFSRRVDLRTHQTCMRWLCKSPWKFDVRVNRSMLMVAALKLD